MAKSNFQSLQGRRDAGIFGLTCKILDGKAIESLQDEFSWCQPYIVEDVKRSTRLSTSMAGRVQIPSLLNVHRKQSVESYRRSCACRMAEIFDRVPQYLIQQVHSGHLPCYQKILKTGQRLLCTDNEHRLPSPYNSHFGSCIE